MADINLCGQFPATPDVSVCADWSENDVWLREQFPAAPDVGVYPVLYWINDPSLITPQLCIGEIFGSATVLGYSLGAADDTWPLRIAASLTTSLTQRIGIPI